MENSAQSNRSRSGAIIRRSELKPDDKHVILTGDRPTGPLHIGHYLGSLRSRVELQQHYKQFILIADVQALSDNFDNPQKVRDNTIEVMLDYLSVGIDPAKCTCYLQSKLITTSELTLYFMNLVNVGRLSRNPTVKAEIEQRGFGEGVPVGFFTYPINQAADIAQFMATLVPVGEDQVPMIELCNDITRAFNRIYKIELFPECKALVGTEGLLPGTDGALKMSKSAGNAMMLCDDATSIAKKVKTMFTDPNHLKVEDPGKVEGNTVFTFLDFFDSDKAELERLKDHYRRGGLGDGVVKKRLTDILNAFLDPIREKRKLFASDKAQVINILKNGTEEADALVSANMEKVRNAIGLFTI
jgi:tryptophanyl-tRNA synthetase